MAKTIKDLYDKKVWEIDFSPEPSLAFAEGFESGANAVLEEIESLIKDVSDEYPRFQQGVIIHGKLIKLLEQLKK